MTMSTPPTIRMNVNQQIHEVCADAQTPLLYVLRNDLKLKGTKFGCGLGQCGACNVLIDGRVTQSCNTPLWDCENKEILTIESFASPEGEFNSLQKAFEEEQAIQCGYCVSGVLISAQALLNKKPNPSDDEIFTALDGNLCRCGTHIRFIRAIKKVIAQGKKSI